ncbi:hypothetical protein [Jannaschia formosa]|uniref:hypothetical protein n=1 Tax=Jannaschia formosa TaxID=2259592 RepID=UPI000E1BEF03|nr:hypothetical protein [Jannaschia formosa]TFL16069.1 hypothetical protein DR046_21985 [Jannaschia formosa]
MPRSDPSSRDERLKAALKSNMARRKAQARARAARAETDGEAPEDEVAAEE